METVLKNKDDLSKNKGEGKNIFNSLKRYVDRVKSNARSAIMRASYVDTRSDTTRKGYHEGRTRYGYNYGANENGITGAIARVIEGKDPNPHLITGVPPMIDKIASPKDIYRIYKALKVLKKVINPKITVKNASKITPKQWTALQDAAIARGDMAEAQRLRDLHFKVNAPNNKLKTKLYHGTDSEWNSYDPTYFSSGSGDLGAWGKGLYLSGYKNSADRYGKNIKRLYAYARNPLEVKPTLGTWYDTPTENAAYFFNREKDATQEVKDILKGKDAVNKYREITGDNWVTTHEPYEEVVIADGRKLKSVDAVTYDDKGVRIPLGDRDNFNVNDIRWSWLLPTFGIGLTGYGLSNLKQGGKMNIVDFLKNGNRIYIKNRGKISCNAKYNRFLVPRNR